MKLNPTIDELETGLMSKRWSEKQRESIAKAISDKIPVVLRQPMPVNQRYITMVVVHALMEQPNGFAELSFTPVWCRAMIGCHARSSDIRLLVVKFDHGQYEFDTTTCQPSQRRMEGPGVDPEDVEQSQYAFAKLLQDKVIQDPVRMACLHIHEKYGRAA